MRSVLDGIKVVELASVLAGPSVGQFLAEVGAQVIKVENPKTRGDVTRGWKSEDERTGDISAYFSATNWAKKSLALDYSKPDGLDILYSLIAKSDIVVMSNKPGDSEKLKTSYRHIKAINDKIIYASITGFGQEDRRVGYDAVIQAESGFMSINGEKNSLPLKLPVAIMDILTGHQLKEAILLGYINKLKTGKGCEVEVSLIDAAISSLANQATNWLVGKKIPEQQGSLHPNIAPYGELFKTADAKMIILAVGNDRQFNNLLNVLNLPTDSRFENNSLRVKNRILLQHTLAASICEFSCDDLIKQLNKVNVPVGIVRDIPEAIERYSGSIIENSEVRGIRNFVANQNNFQNHSHFLPPPSYGAHSKSILLEMLGLSPEKIDKLISKGIIHTS